MNRPGSATNSCAPQTTELARYRFGLHYSIGGDARYLAHHDELRMLIRAFVRAEWPLAYSQGYNPLPRVRLLLPRNVGIASNAQLAVIDLSEPREPSELLTSVAHALPQECSAQCVTPLDRKCLPQAQVAEYEVILDGSASDDLRQRVDGCLASETLLVSRDFGPGKPRKTIDIRPYIELIELQPTLLRLRLRIDNQQTGRPAELLTELGLDPQVMLPCTRRVAVQWNHMPAAENHATANERN